MLSNPFPTVSSAHHQPSASLPHLLFVFCKRGLPSSTNRIADDRPKWHPSIRAWQGLAKGTCLMRQSSLVTTTVRRPGSPVRSHAQTMTEPAVSPLLDLTPRSWSKHITLILVGGRTRVARLFRLAQQLAAVVNGLRSLIRHTQLLLILSFSNLYGKLMSEQVGNELQRSGAWQSASEITADRCHMPRLLEGGWKLGCIGY